MYCIKPATWRYQELITCTCRFALSSVNVAYLAETGMCGKREPCDTAINFNPKAFGEIRVREVTTRHCVIATRFAGCLNNSRKGAETRSLGFGLLRIHPSLAP